LCPVTEFISHKTNPKEWGATGLLVTSPALEILRRPQHQVFLNMSLSTEPLTTAAADT
jgi:hypothetical protein